jgi:hypothetical protein
MDPHICLLRRRVSPHNYLLPFLILNFRAVLFSIDLGALNLKANEPNRQRFATDIYVAHPDYNPTTLENDIGLIQLRMPIGFTSKSLSLLVLNRYPDF